MKLKWNHIPNTTKFKNGSVKSIIDYFGISIANNKVVTFEPRKMNKHSHSSLFLICILLTHSFHFSNFKKFFSDSYKASPGKKITCNFM